MVRDKKISCCFTGHRNIPEDKYKEIRSLVRSEMYTLILLSGVRNFIAGGALGFDTLCAECVCEIKEEYPSLGIKLHLYLPCTDQTKNWRSKDISKYEEIKNHADSCIFVTNSEYTRDCMKKRNYRMVDDCAYCIAYFSGRTSGTSQTVNYALKNNVVVINLFKKIVFR
ncbi:MAG: DUF1273 family protein [Oscillospiraceae bacterium]|nr:DUF1273 family protein [Oscillospiraceae bacterium]